MTKLVAYPGVAWHHGHFKEMILSLNLYLSDYEGPQNYSNIEVLTKALKTNIKADNQKFGKIRSCINSLRTSNS